MKSLVFLLLLASLAAGQVPTVYSTSGVVASRTIPLPKVTSGTFTLLFSIDPPSSGPRLLVEVLDGDRVQLAKTLHAGDADLYAPLHFAAPPHAALRLTAQ